MRWPSALPTRAGRRSEWTTLLEGSPPFATGSRPGRNTRLTTRAKSTAIRAYAMCCNSQYEQEVVTCVAPRSPGAKRNFAPGPKVVGSRYREDRMSKSTLSMLIAAALTLAPIQVFAQGVGSPPPPKPGDPAAASGTSGGSAPPLKPGARTGGSSGSVGSPPPPRPGPAAGDKRGD
jgi:hypothetical protein